MKHKAVFPSFLVKYTFPCSELHALDAYLEESLSLGLELCCNGQHLAT